MNWEQLNSEQTAMIMGIFMGSLGGVLAALDIIFDRFRSLDSVPMKKSKRAKSGRLAFLLMRVAYGAGLGFAITFWFMDDFLSESLSGSKLAFIQCVTGYGSSILQIAISKIRQLLNAASDDEKLTP